MSEFQARDLIRSLPDSDVFINFVQCPRGSGIGIGLMYWHPVDEDMGSVQLKTCLWPRIEINRCWIGCRDEDASNIWPDLLNANWIWPLITGVNAFRICLRKHDGFYILRVCMCERSERSLQSLLVVCFANNVLSMNKNQSFLGVNRVVSSCRYADMNEKLKHAVIKEWKELNTTQN